MEEWVNGPNGTDSCVLLGLSLWNQVCFLCEREGFYLEKSLLMTGPATGRPTVFSLCAIVCIYMLGIRCKSRSLPKGLKRSCQFVFFIIQSKVLRQTLSELFFNKKLQTFSLGNLRWNFFIAQRSARKSTLGDSEFVSACPKRHFIFATLLAGYVRRSLKFISTKYRVHTFFRPQ